MRVPLSILILGAMLVPAWAHTHYETVPVHSLTSQALGKSVIVHTNSTVITSTGPLPPKGMDAFDKDGKEVVHGRLESFAGDTIKVSMGYGDSNPINRKWFEIDKKYVEKLEIDR